jgi:beta-phosphoglucomutase-like phosphatase (HAD superfamily)
VLNNKKIIIFDLDGTLIDSIDIWNQIDVELVRRICGKKINFSEIDELRDNAMANCKQGEDKYLMYFSALAKKYDSKLLPLEISKMNDDIAMEMLKTYIDYKPGAEKLIKYLYDQNFILVIATTSPNYMVNVYINDNINILRKADMKLYFNKIYTKESVKNLKPNPEVYLKILSDYKVSSFECISIEDSIEGIIASKNAGIDVIALYDKYSDKHRKEINDNSNFQVNSFDDLLMTLKKEKIKKL